MNSLSDLKDKKAEIEQREKEEQQRKGKQEAMMEEIKRNTGASTLDELQKLLDDNKEKFKTLNELCSKIEAKLESVLDETETS